VAKEVAGLHVEMTAGMGKRTKHQHSEYAQLYLYAKSKLLGGDSDDEDEDGADENLPPPPAELKAPPAGAVLPPKLKRDQSSGAAATSAAVPVLPPKLHGEISSTAPHSNANSGGASDANPNAWQHGEWEMGRRMVREGQNGEEVAVREVLLDSVDGGAAENIILEGGPKFSAETDQGGALHPVDQAIVLALCLDVSNSNAADGLTNEEMLPYVERVLGLAANWMIHSTALLERSWLEFERRKTMDRAMLQIQALIDQHTTKLTLMQSTYKSIEDSAPVQDRMKYLYSIVYPAQYELKRDLAVRYLRCQVFQSALNYFRELEMWDEVVTCYQLMDKPHRAELVVREQLEKAGETPYMLTSLADLTRKEEYYVRAWEISKGRYPRAMRTLGKICFDRSEFEQCVLHLDEALSVHPLVATAWYLRGIACMRLERWEDAIQSFVRCVQQDMEIGEAWANIGAVNMRLKQWAKANEALTEALRHKHDSWRIIENLMIVAMALGKWRDVLRYMQRLLELRDRSQRPFHKDELRHVCYIVASQGQREAARARHRAFSASASNLMMVAATPIPGLEGPLEAALNPFGSNQPSPNNHDVEPSPAILAALASLREILTEEPDFDPDDMDGMVKVEPLTDLPALADRLLMNIANAVPSDAEVWDIYADFQHALGRFRLELECRTKQVRHF
jgi:tetratricopeptide (TPR) repeat protein